MKIEKLTLQNFRNHTKKTWEYSSKILVVGENGSGKSNMLEAIYMLATGKSFRADKEEEMIAYGQQYSVLRAQCSFQSQTNNLQISLTDGTMGVTRKKFELNGVSKRMIDFVGTFKAVLFGPEDLELVTGSPSGRRRYLDFVISQTDREYRRCQISYEKGLRQRNKLLERIREGFASRSQLFFWDRLLIKDGNYLTDKREEYISKLSDGEIERLSFRAKYDKSVISESRLKQYETEEVAAAATLVGPHRDDFIIAQAPNSKSQDTNKSQIQNSNDQTDITSPLTPLQNLGEGNWKDVSKFGSRGEQRMAVMWLKRGELNYLTNEGEPPVLLLDDIFSELDHKHRSEIEIEIERLVKAGGQVIMSTADENNIPTGKDWHTIRL